MKMSRKLLPQARRAAEIAAQVLVVASLPSCSRPWWSQSPAPGRPGRSHAHVPESPARAASAGPTGLAGAATAASTATSGPKSINGDFQGTRPRSARYRCCRSCRARSTAARSSRSSRPRPRQAPRTRSCRARRAQARSPGRSRTSTASACRSASRAALPEQLQLPPARHERRGRRDPVRPDGEHRLRRLLEEPAPCCADATPINQLWANAGGECETHNNGDPVVVYDQLANRWLLSQFIASAGDRRGVRPVLRRLDDEQRDGLVLPLRVPLRPTFHDYPKLGVWPDAYYMSSNEFPDGQQTSAAPAPSPSSAPRCSPASPLASSTSTRRRQPAGRPVHRPAPGRPRRLHAAARRLAESLRRDRRRRALSRRRLPEPRLQAAALEVPRRLGQPGQLDLREQRRAELRADVAPYVRPQCVYGYGPTACRRRAGRRGSTSSATG